MFGKLAGLLSVIALFSILYLHRLKKKKALFQLDKGVYSRFGQTELAP